MNEKQQLISERMQAVNPDYIPKGGEIWKDMIFGGTNKIIGVHKGQYWLRDLIRGTYYTKPLLPSEDCPEDCPTKVHGVELDWDKYVYKLPDIKVPYDVKWPEGCHGGDPWEGTVKGNVGYYLYRCPVEDWCDKCMRPNCNCKPDQVLYRLYRNEDGTLVVKNKVFRLERIVNLTVEGCRFAGFKGLGGERWSRAQQMYRGAYADASHIIFEARK